MRHTWTSMLVPTSSVKAKRTRKWMCEEYLLIRNTIVVLHSVSWDHLSLCYRVIGRAMTVSGSPHIANSRIGIAWSLIDKHLSLLGNHLDYRVHYMGAWKNFWSEHLNLRSKGVHKRVRVL